jgi:hypothetical protein
VSYHQYGFCQTQCFFCETKLSIFLFCLLTCISVSVGPVGIIQSFNHSKSLSSKTKPFFIIIILTLKKTQKPCLNPSGSALFPSVASPPLIEQVQTCGAPPDVSQLRWRGIHPLNKNAYMRKLNKKSFQVKLFSPIQSFY